MSNTANPKGEEKDWVKRYDVLRKYLNMEDAINKLVREVQSSTPPTESEPDFGFAHWASAMGWVFDFADEMWYKEIGGDENIGVSAIKTDQQLYSLYQTHLQETKNKEQ